MKNKSRILEILLALSLLFVCVGAHAETSLKPGYAVEESNAPLFDVLPAEHYDVSAITEYDRQHFVPFKDPQTGFWGIGLKKESCPIGSEGGVFTYENAAEILLKNAAYSPVLSEPFSVRITLDKVTYAAMPGFVLNEQTDVLGVFGFSRGMETVGFLAGWGSRALRDEAGDLRRSGDVLLTDDSKAYDCALLCTEVEFTVTPVTAANTPLVPEHLNAFTGRWPIWIRYSPMRAPRAKTGMYMNGDTLMRACS